MLERFLSSDRLPVDGAYGAGFDELIIDFGDGSRGTLWRKGR